MRAAGAGARQLVQLQESLFARGVQECRRQLLPLEIGQLRVALPFHLVQRVTLPSVVMAVPPTPHIPSFVSGVASCGPLMVTVIDAGMLLGLERTARTMKTRLVVLGDGSMQGFALLVSRVHDPIEAQDQAAKAWTLISDHDLAARLAQHQETA